MAGLVLTLLALVVVGPALFTSDDLGAGQDPASALAVMTLGLAWIVLGIWAFVLFLKAIGEAQGFSAWKAWGNFLLSAAVVLLPVVALGVFASLLASAPT